ncbi:MAG: hypothetical protein R3F29_06060 [Planctomycetota bacterium]
MPRQHLSQLFALAAALSAVSPAQQATPARPRPVEVVTLTANEPFAALAPRLLQLLPTGPLAKVDAAFAADDRPDLAARITALIPALGDIATAWIDPHSLDTAPRLALRIGFAEPSGIDAAQQFVLQLVNDWTRIAPGDVWHVAWDTTSDWWMLGGRGEQKLCVAVSKRGLTIANSQQWFEELRRTDHLAAEATPPQPGHLRITTPLQSLRTQLVRRDEIGRWLQIGLDVLGGGFATIDVEVDALDRLATFLPR